MMQTQYNKPGCQVAKYQILKLPNVSTVNSKRCVLVHATDNNKKVVVVGAGWAGFGACKHLCEQGYDVTLLDAAENPGGLAAGWRTSGGKQVEAGMKGFWYQYHNIFSLLKELPIEWPLTRYETSGFWSPSGLVVDGPVLQSYPRYPAPLGQVIHVFPRYKTLSPLDRLSLLTLLYAVIDHASDDETYSQYDQMTARELFRAAGVTQRAYDDFIKPILLVGLFAPPEDVSAAEAMAAFYFYAMAHQPDFDVCWCNGSVAEKIFEPLINKINDQGGKVVGKQVVKDLVIDENTGNVNQVVAFDLQKKADVKYDCDAVIISIGITGMQKLISACPVLAKRQEFRNIMSLKGLDVLSTRMWLDKKVTTKYPANVVSGFDSDAGGTYFHLNMLQDEYKDLDQSVISADIYHSNNYMAMSDDDVIDRLKSILNSCEPDAFMGAKVVDSAVLRFPKAVTHFSAGSLPFRPRQVCSIPNLFLGGDWVRDVPHGANGLSQERAYVTGLLAGNLVVDKCGVGSAHEILQVEKDEPHITLMKQGNKQVKGMLQRLGFSNPFINPLLL